VDSPIHTQPRVVFGGSAIPADRRDHAVDEKLSFSVLDCDIFAATVATIDLFFRFFKQPPDLVWPADYPPEPRPEETAPAGNGERATSDSRERPQTPAAASTLPAAQTVAAEGILRVALFAANPGKTERLRLDAEVREIEGKIREAQLRERIEFRPELATRQDDVIRVLNDRVPHVVQFSGHGGCGGRIILHDRNDKPKELGQKGLKAIFGAFSGKVRLVVFNACFSRPLAEALTEFVDCAIGVPGSIVDDSAILFAATFYRAVATRGRSIKEAFEQGRAAVIADDEETPEDELPQLIARPGLDPGNVYLLGE
jgi:hypothetical protein